MRFGKSKLRDALRIPRALCLLGALGVFSAPTSFARASELAFSAEEAEVSLEERELRLRGDVVITLDRFRLTSDELVLRELPDGVAVDGPARLSFCDCPSAPFAIGFDRAVFEEPGDWKLSHPRLEVGGVTVFALPWFWLRAPSQPGLLPPTIALRGADGWLLGGGVHLPWDAGESALGLSAAGYTQGGFELRSALLTPSSSVHLRWDRMRGDLLAIDALGSKELGREAGSAWDIDAILGPRARSGTIELEAAARPYDRAGIESTMRLGPVMVASGMRAIGARGPSGPGEGSAWGPRLSLLAGGAAGPNGEWDALVTGEVLAVPEAMHIARAESGIALSARPGPFATRLSMRESLMLLSSERMAGLDAALSLRAEAGLPLLREFGGKDALPLVHLVEPRAELTGLLAHTSGDYWEHNRTPLQVTGGRAAVASAGIRTALGRPLGGAASLELAAGAFLPSELHHAEPLACYRGGWASRYLGLSGEGAASLREGGQVFLGRGRVGALDASYLALRVAGRTGIEPIAARMLASSALRSPSGGWLAFSGFSAGSDVGTRLLRVLILEGGADADVTERRLLGVRAALGYEHPCGCLAANLFGQRRLGREGVDVWASVEVAP